MRVAIAVVTIAVVLSALVLWFHFATRPPNEAATIANFYSHRAGYDELREMLLADSDLVRVADWGVQTSDSAVRQVPPQGRFPAACYRKYLSLLTEIGAKGAFRTNEVRPEIGVQVWVSGFGIRRRHATRQRMLA
jgi:hypothetical protein